jgi:hypothetical protein
VHGVHGDPGLAQLAGQQVSGHRGEQLRPCIGFERHEPGRALATAEGELDMTADPRDVLALLGGPILPRTCMEAGTVSDDLIDRLLDSLGTWHPRPD